MKRAIRILSGVVLGLVLLVVVVVGAGTVYLRTESGRETAANLITDVATQPDGSGVAIGSLGEGFPLRLAANEVVVRDTAGPWLKVGAAAISWKPLALFSARVHVTDATVNSVEVLRSPEPSAEPEPEPADEGPGFAIPSLPVDVRIDSLTIDPVTIDEAVAGEAVRFRLDGHLAADAGDTIGTRLHLRRIDGPGLEVIVEADLDPKAETVALAVQATEPEDGMVMKLAGLAPYPPLTLSLRGQGPLDDWTGRLEAEATDLFSVSADLTASTTPSLELTGTADVTGLLEPPLSAVVGSSLTFETSANLEDDILSIDYVRVGAAALSLEASGTVDPAEDRITASAAATVTDASLLTDLTAPAAFSGARLDLDIDGKITIPSISATGRVDSVRLPGASASAVLLSLVAAPKTAELEQITVEARIDAQDLTLDDATAASVVGDTGSVTATGLVDLAEEVVVLDQLTADISVAGVSGQARYGLGDGAVDAEAEVKIEDLSAFSSVAGMPLQGAGLVSFDAAGNVETMAITGKIAAALTDAKTGDPMIDGILGPSVDFSAGFALAGEDDLTIQDVSLDTALAELRGKATLTEAFDKVSADVKATVASLEPLSAGLGTPLDGSLTVEVSAEGSVADPSVQLRLQAPSVTADGNQLTDIDLKVSADTAVTAPNGTVELTAGTPMGPASISTGYALVGGNRLDIRGLRADAAGLGLAGDAAVPFDGSPIDGTVTGQLARSGVALGDQRLTGNATFEARLSGGGGAGQNATVDLSANDLKIASGNDVTLSLNRLTLRGNVTDALGTPGLQVDIAADALQTGSTVIDSIEVDAGGRLDNGRFAITASGSQTPDFQLDAAGTFGLDGGTTRVELATFETTIADHSAVLQSPAVVTLRGNQTLLDSLSLKVDDGQVLASADIGGSNPTVQLTMESLPVGLADLAAPDLKLKGTVDANIDLRRDGRGLGGTLAITVADLVQETSSIAASPPVTINLDGQWANGTVDAQATVSGIGEDLTATARMPVFVDARTLAPNINESVPISAQVRWQGDAGPLIEALPLDEHLLTGPGRISIDVAGTLDAPQVTGEVTLTDATYEHLVFGTLIKPLNLDVVATGGEVFTVDMSGRDGGSGTIAANGRIDLGGAPDVTLNADINQAVLVRRDDVTAKATANLAVKLDQGGGSIDGNVRTNRIDIDIGQSNFPPSVVSLDVIEIRTDEDAAAAAERESSEPPPPPDAPTLDLTVDIPNQVFVRGRGLESEWSGNLVIRGTTAAPSITGLIESIRGTFRFAERQFRLSKGKVEFLGGRTIDPLLDIQVTHEGKRATAVVSVTGESSDPTISITSPNGVPESEILPLALFDKNSSELSPGEALSIASSIDTLRGGSSITESSIGSIRDALGLSTLSLDTGLGTDSGPGVEVGRYVTEDIYVESRLGTEPGTTRYRAEYRITPEISAEMELGDPRSDTQGFLGLLWQRDY